MDLTDPLWVTAGLTGALVLVTGVYAILNHGALEEMRKSRTQALLPHLVLSLTCWEEDTG